MDIEKVLLQRADHYLTIIVLSSTFSVIQQNPIPDIPTAAIGLLCLIFAELFLYGLRAKQETYALTTWQFEILGLVSTSMQIVATTTLSALAATLGNIVTMIQYGVVRNVVWFAAAIMLVTVLKVARPMRAHTAKKLP